MMPRKTDLALGGYLLASMRPRRVHLRPYKARVPDLFKNGAKSSVARATYCLPDPTTRNRQLSPATCRPL